MKDSLKQTVLTVICIIIVFIPTYIAIAYFGTRQASDTETRYSVEITAYSGETFAINEREVDALAKTILKMNSELEQTSSVDVNTLPKKYYDIKVTDNGSVSSYRYYFSTNPNNRTLVSDPSGVFYSLEFKDVKAFLSKDCAYLLYDNSSLPVLSIFGGEDIIPVSAKWSYRTANGLSANAPVKTTDDVDKVYSMSGQTPLSFGAQPDKCTIKIYLDGKEHSEVESLDRIPYELLDSRSLSFVINAEWTSLEDCRGSAEYKFSTSIGKPPEFFVLGNTTLEDAPDDTVFAGDFFTLVGTNVSAPQKIRFSSSPKIDISPVFFAEGKYVYALIPIPDNKSGNMSYTLRLEYGESVTELTVHAIKRDLIEHKDYDNTSIGVRRTEENLKEYRSLLSEIGLVCESEKYFSNKLFIDYDIYYTGATVQLGFGHKRIPRVDDEEYYLDGVDYIMDYDVRAIAAGKVVYSGSCALLGNFVVVDHGMGLKTWYCHIGTVLAKVGDIVAREDVIGTPGKTGYTTINGVYLITTIMDMPVSPYPMQEKGIRFAQ